MKKIIMLLFCLAYSFESLFAVSLFTIGVPQQLFDQKSSLMLYLIDQDGNQSIGKCPLDGGKCPLDGICDRKIFQNQLEITTLQEEKPLDVIVDLMDFQTTEQDLIVLHFEFENAVRVLRVLVVKDSFFEPDPFNVVEISYPTIHTPNDFSSELDDLSALVADVDSQAVQESIQRQAKISKFKEYMLYLEIFALMQLGSAKRALGNMKHIMSSWLSYSY